MNNFFKPFLGISILCGALLIAGCNSDATQIAGEGAATPRVATQTDAKPAATTASEESGHDHGAKEMGGMTMKPRTSTTKLAFSSNPSAIPVGKPVTWNLQISDAKSGDAVNDFEVEMTKKMHLIVVKNDLSWFNHVHPQFQGGGKFTVTTALPSAGTYKLYADYTLANAGQEVPQFEFATGGQTVTPAKVSIVPDKMSGSWLVGHFNAHPESEPDTKGGAVYEVALMPMPMPIVAGQDVMLHFQIRNSVGTPVKDLQPYLGAMGHCVILSSDTNSYLHSHPMSGEGKMSHSMGDMKMGDMKGMDHSMSAMKMDAPKSGGPDVMFHTNFPHAGLYKVWGQFQHKGKIITANYVVSVAPGQGGSTGAAHEAMPHSD